MFKAILASVLALISILAVPQDASAFVGSDSGLSMLGAFWGLIVAILAALSFFVLWPFRNTHKKDARTTDTDPEQRPAP